MVAEPIPFTAQRSSPLRRTTITNTWDELVFLHWPVDPAMVTPLLPPGLRVDVYEGRAWVSLVPFVMRRATRHLVPPLPWLSNFAETNVRTYTVDDDGQRVIWFHSLDATRLPVVALARWLLGFPYVWSVMRVHVEGDERTYHTLRRRWPARPPGHSRVRIHVGAPLPAMTPLDTFLTARWAAATLRRGRLLRAPVEHPAWHLHHAELLEFDDSLLAAAGYDAPSAPIVRFCPAIDARFGPLEISAAARRSASQVWRKRP